MANLGAQTLPEMLDHAAKTHTSKSALTTILPTGAETSITYSELQSQAGHFAVYLRDVLGLKSGETVAVISPT